MKPDYGIDAPGIVRGLALGGLGAIVAGVVFSFISAPVAIACFVAAFFLLASAGGMVYSSRVLKLRERDRVLDSITWRGDERVLDVGCGRGLLLIGAARRLDTGKATGIDIWSQKDLSANRPRATTANAEAEGVADRIELHDADARELPFADETFDVVLSSFVIHNIPSSDGRDAALKEIARVLKPGGCLTILDIAETDRYKRRLAEHGLEQVRRSGPRPAFFPLTRVVTASKPRRRNIQT